MNQLTPPPERDLWAPRQAQIRRTLARHLTPTSRLTHPFRTPVLASGAAVGLAAVAMAGFSAWPGGDPDRTNQTGEPSVAGGAPAAATDPVEWCHGQLDDEFDTPAESPNESDFARWPLDTGPTRQTPDGTVQILVDATRNTWWACDTAIGTTAEYSVHLAVGSMLPRVNETWNYALLSADTGPGTYFWGAGQLPPGVDSVRFTFPDGHVEDGFWSVNYQADEAFPDDAKVRTEAGGESFTVPWRACVIDRYGEGWSATKPCGD